MVNLWGWPENWVAKLKFLIFLGKKNYCLKILKFIQKLRNIFTKYGQPKNVLWSWNFLETISGGTSTIFLHSGEFQLTTLAQMLPNTFAYFVLIYVKKLSAACTHNSLCCGNFSLVLRFETTMTRNRTVENSLLLFYMCMLLYAMLNIFSVLFTR